MKIQHFYDPETFTLTYVVYDEKTKDAVVIDPVLDFDQASGKLFNKNVEAVLSFINDQRLELRAILETHAHADHLSGSQLLKGHFPNAKVGIGERITEVQETFKAFFNLQDLHTDGTQFDLLFSDNEEVSFGSLKMRVIPTPGHTPACVSYLFGNSLFTGDALFMPDYGTGRCDFPRGSATDLYQSVHERIYSLPDETKVYVGHDYQPEGRELRFETTVGESKKRNIQLRTETTEAEFVRFREERDRTLKAPRLLLPSIQVNVDAGHLPRALTLPLSPSFPLKYVKENVPTMKISKASDLQGFQLVDVRREDEFVGELGHVDGAQLHTLGQDLERYLERAPKDVPTLFICRSGARSAGATTLARKLGFKEAYNLEGGMIRWNQLGLPAVRP